MAGLAVASAARAARAGDEEHYAPYIARARATAGGHLAVGAYGSTLWFGRSCRLSDGDTDAILVACVAAGLPVIDTRGLPHEVLAAFIPRMPLVAVGEPADPPPWHGLSRAPLAHVLGLYAQAGAIVLNLPSGPVAAPGEGEAGRAGE